MTDNAVSHPLAQRIASLRLPGMLAAFLEQMARHDLGDMPFEDRLALLIEPRGIRTPIPGPLQRRLKKAQLRHQDACFEDINLRPPPRARPQPHAQPRRLRLGPQVPPIS